MKYQLFENYNPNRKHPNEQRRWYFTKSQTKYTRGLLSFDCENSLQWYLDRVKEADEYAAKIGLAPAYPLPTSWSRVEPIRGSA